jgi:hypothetical protein
MEILLTIVLPILSLLMAGGGVWTLLAARATAKATKDAALAAADVASKQAATADWSGLMTYWQAEVKELRSDNKKIEVRLLFLEQQREDDLQHIADLEHHIWQQLPPPPPMRRPARIEPPQAP